MKTKNRVLAILENNRGDFVSGEQIAAELQLSRNAVWKAIKQLEEEGYALKAIRNKGYCLSKENNQMSSIGIIEHFNDDLKNKPVYYFDRIDSTNKKAKELAVKGSEHGTLIVSNEQTDGKGRYGRTFESPKNTGIYMSLILNPTMLVFDEPTIITAYAAVVVANAIKSFTGKKVGIKWVNDLFLNDKKVCGILTEAVTNFENGEIEWIVLGIGINLSTECDVFSKEIQNKVGSVLKEQDKSINRNQMVARIVTDILSYQEEKNQEEIMTEYRQASIVLHKNVLLQQGKNQFNAFIEDIDKQGQLLIKREGGEYSIFNSGEIRILLD